MLHASAPTRRDARRRCSRRTRRHRPLRSVAQSISESENECGARLRQAVAQSRKMDPAHRQSHSRRTPLFDRYEYEAWGPRDPTPPRLSSPLTASAVSLPNSVRRRRRTRPRIRTSLCERLALRVGRERHAQIVSALPPLASIPREARGRHATVCADAARALLRRLGAERRVVGASRGTICSMAPVSRKPIPTGGFDFRLPLARRQLLRTVDATNVTSEGATGLAEDV
jgi:hypothetical protein